jgi:hypothetical protein
MIRSRILLIEIKLLINRSYGNYCNQGGFRHRSLCVLCELCAFVVAFVSS